jgi:hypothetical protein
MSMGAGTVRKANAPGPQVPRARRGAAAPSNNRFHRTIPGRDGMRGLPFARSTGFAASRMNPSVHTAQSRSTEGPAMSHPKRSVGCDPDDCKVVLHLVGAVGALVQRERNAADFAAPLPRHGATGLAELIQVPSCSPVHEVQRHGGSGDASGREWHRTSETPHQSAAMPPRRCLPCGRIHALGGRTRFLLPISPHGNDR